jgi:hypothetical protein
MVKLSNIQVSIETAVNCNETQKSFSMTKTRQQIDANTMKIKVLELSYKYF